MTASRKSFGAPIMAFSSALRVVIQVISLPIIGRILGPDAYGQVALVTPFVFFSMLLAESGLGAAIVRAETVTDELEGTVFCFSAVLSVIFIALFTILAHPLGQLLNQPQFPGLLIGMSSLLLLASLNIVPGSLLIREKKYGWVAASDLASSAGGLAGVVLGLSLGWGAWSLVAQQVAFWICKLIIVTVGSGVRPRFIFNLPIVKDNMRFGFNLTASSILFFIAQNIDNVLIGRFLGAQALGFYALAYQIVSIPGTVLAGSIYFSIFSSTSEANRTDTSPSPHFLSTLRGVSLIIVPAIVGLAVTAPLSVRLLLGEQWFPTGLMIVLLSPLSLAQTFGVAGAGFINGLGRADTALRIGVVTSLLTIVAILACIPFGSAAVAIGVSLASVAYPVLAFRTIIHKSAMRYREIFDVMYKPIIATIIMAIGVLALRLVLPLNLPAAFGLTICVVVGVGLYVCILRFIFCDSLADDIIQVKLALRRGSGEISDQ